MAAASNIPRFLIGISLLPHYALKPTTEKCVTPIRVVVSTPCVTYRGAFPKECSSLYGSRSPPPAETSFQGRSGSCFLPLVMLGVSLHLVTYLSFFTAYFAVVESLTEVWLFVEFLHLPKTHFFL